MVPKVKFIRPVVVRSVKQEQFVQARPPRNDLTDIVIDGELLWIKRALSQLKAELRQLELEELKRKYQV